MVSLDHDPIRAVDADGTRWLHAVAREGSASVALFRRSEGREPEHVGSAAEEASELTLEVVDGGQEGCRERRLGQTRASCFCRSGASTAP